MLNKLQMKLTIVLNLLVAMMCKGYFRCCTFYYSLWKISLKLISVDIFAFVCFLMSMGHVDNTFWELGAQVRWTKQLYNLIDSFKTYTPFPQEFVFLTLNMYLIFSLFQVSSRMKCVPLLTVKWSLQYWMRCDDKLGWSTRTLTRNAL